METQMVLFLFLALVVGILAFVEKTLEQMCDMPFVSTRKFAIDHPVFQQLEKQKCNKATPGICLFV
jgi:hypothetical protein